MKSTTRLPMRGFTLVELSIVLVIIALVAGGILAGRELIAVASLRAQISQLETFTRATNAFRLKYNCLPGDCKKAASFGLKPRGNVPGTGDGDGVLVGLYAYYAEQDRRRGTCENAENLMYWVDLSMSGLIADSFTAATAIPPNVAIEASDLRNYFPASRAGDSHIYVYSLAGQNYYGLSGVSEVTPNGQMHTASGLTTFQASWLDSKIDDGMPRSGKVLARYVSANCEPELMTWSGWASDTVADSGSASSCYDNAGNTANPVIYSTRYKGDGINCGLSFKW